jgi:23S rRNA pseudouridine2605 synthase
MERLQKVIAQAGVTSRRKAESLIIEGKVKVNGKIVKELGTKVSANDKIEVNEIPVEREQPVYFLFYKPSGVISAVSDDRNRKVVTDFFQHIEQRIFPIGRLDYDTSGIILLTNDGEFANILTHPKHEVDKEYIAKVKGIPEKEKIKQLERGINLEDGKTAPAKVKVMSVDKRKDTSIVRLIIHEGRNRQVKRMLEAIGHPVKKLKRERFAFLDLRGMNPGDFRELTPKEVNQLRHLAVTQGS